MSWVEEKTTDHLSEITSHHEQKGAGRIRISGYKALSTRVLGMNTLSIHYLRCGGE
jgi:hypothetical protein